MIAVVDFMVSGIGQIPPLLLPADHFGPIRDTIRLNMLKEKLETVPLTLQPTYEIFEQSL